MQPKYVSIGKLPITKFEDPILNGNPIIHEALKSILQITVCCVFETRIIRPTIEQVSVELNKAWRSAILVGLLMLLIGRSYFKSNFDAKYCYGLCFYDFNVSQ